MNNENQRFYIFVSWKNGRDATEIHDELVNAIGEQALSIVTIRRWVAKYKDGEIDFDDKPRSGRPREAVTSEKIAKVQELVANDPHITTEGWRRKQVYPMKELCTFCITNWASTKFVRNGFPTSFQHHDNAAPHKAGIVTEYLNKERVKLLPHPPYSPDLALCDFYLFPKIKHELGGKSFNSVENLSRAIQAITEAIPKEEYYKSFQSWQDRLKKCIEVEGEYFEGM